MGLRFEDLDLWRESREFCKDIYKITRYDLFNKDFRFRDQVRASSGSIMDNIAEGFERNGNKEFIQYLKTSQITGHKNLKPQTNNRKSQTGG